MLTQEQKSTAMKEGSLRLMTLGEIAMARQVFGNALIYSRIWVHCDSYHPFGLQGKHVGMSPDGEIYFRKEEYLADFSKTGDYSKQQRSHRFTPSEARPGPGAGSSTRGRYPGCSKTGQTGTLSSGRQSDCGCSPGAGG